MKRVYIVTQNDLIHYPPLQTLLTIFLKQRILITFVGEFSDITAKHEFEKQGVVFRKILLDEYGTLFNKIHKRRLFTKKIRKFFISEKLGNDDLIWYIYSGATVCCISDVVRNYNYVVHFYEFFNSIHSWKHRILYPNYNLSDFLKSANGVVHCEYNRAQICRGLYGLDAMPYIIPNKPFFDECKLENLPEDILTIISNFKNKIKGRKPIIYQGFFSAKERRLEEFCQSIFLLPKEFVLVIMGRGNVYFDVLKEKYESDRIIFIPFIRPPYHLLITELASIGILTYHPEHQNYPGVINPLYCAPNKIFEYGKYGIPMIGNDIPGLHYLFKEYKCGKTISYPITPEKIATCIQSIDCDNRDYKLGSHNLYNSVNIEETIVEILKSIKK